MSTTAQIPVLDLHPQVDALWDELNEALQRVLKSTHFILGPEERTFESEMAAYLGVKHAVGLNSGTDGLFIALRALGVGPGDEVITTPFTFFATAEATSHVGATPVFADVQLNNYNIDPEQIEKAITPKTKAILPVHLFGRPCDMTAIMAVADKYGIPVVEDCAQSIGAKWQGRMTGSMGRLGTYSFFPTKNLGGYGDGGLIVTNDDELAATARMLRVHGSRKRYHNEAVGYNSRLDEMQAAILRVKLPHLDRWNAQRRQVAQRYRELFAGCDRIITPEVVDGHVFHQYTIRVLDVDGDALQAKLAEMGIATMVYYPVPCHRMKLYEQSHAKFHFPLTERLAKEVISLPIWPELDADTQQTVAEGVLKAIKG